MVKSLNALKWGSQDTSKMPSVLCKSTFLAIERLSLTIAMMIPN